MITAKEINTFARQLGVPAVTIDKDWVLGHLLSGIYQDAYLRDNLVFKGGTCLKKCYFENYRFSEDLDFTALHAKKSKLLSSLGRAVQDVQSETGILFGKIRSREKVFNGILAACQFSVPYWGACHPKNKQPPPEKRWTSAIKLDVTFHEVLCLENQKKDIFHPYSDGMPNRSVVCYAIEEIISEKLRALLQRSYVAPRDCYDLWYIARNVPSVSWEVVTAALKAKCTYKKIVITSMDNLFERNRLAACEKEWYSSLGHHLRVLPVFDQVLSELKTLMAENNICGVL